MTKYVRIENADMSSFKVVVQVWDKGYPEGQPDTLVKEIPLDYPTAMSNEYLTSTRYMVVKEVEPVAVPAPAPATDAEAAPVVEVPLVAADESAPVVEVPVVAASDADTPQA